MNKEPNKLKKGIKPGKTSQKPRKIVEFSGKFGEETGKMGLELWSLVLGFSGKIERVWAVHPWPTFE